MPTISSYLSSRTNTEKRDLSTDGALLPTMRPSATSKSEDSERKKKQQLSSRPRTLDRLRFANRCLNRGNRIMAKVFGDFQKHFSFSVVTRNQYSIRFRLNGILEPEVDWGAFTGPLQQ